MHCHLKNNFDYALLHLSLFLNIWKKKSLLKLCSRPGRGGDGGWPRGRGGFTGRGRGRGGRGSEKVSAEDLDADLDKYHKAAMETS